MSRSLIHILNTVLILYLLLLYKYGRDCKIEIINNIDSIIRLSEYFGKS